MNPATYAAMAKVRDQLIRKNMHDEALVSGKLRRARMAPIMVDKVNK